MIYGPPSTTHVGGPSYSLALPSRTNLTSIASGGAGGAGGMGSSNNLNLNQNAQCTEVYNRVFNEILAQGGSASAASSAAASAAAAAAAAGN